MTLFTFLDYFGTMVFAISGTMSAAEKRLDMFGAMFIGFVTAVGGGTVRDLMIGDRPVGWLQSPIYFYVIVLGVIITFMFQKQVSKLRNTLFLFDTIGIGLFTIIGLEKALNFGIDTPLAVVMGLSSAVVGGVMRDTLNNEVPLIFHKELYATACIIGAIIYLMLSGYTDFSKSVNQIMTITAIIIIRIVAIRYNVGLPRLIPVKHQSDS
jgi:uncharacterized membrane protein YeiH